MNDHCIEWSGSRFASGYGRLKSHGKSARSHRWAWEKFFGPIPAGLMVCHRCDNPPCINPLHLFLGTCKDNLADMSRKGRSVNQKKTQCRHGHSLEGVIPGRDGRRTCKQCRLKRELQRWHRDPEASRAKSRAYYARTADIRRRQKRESDARRAAVLIP